MNDPILLWHALEVAGSVIVALLGLLWWFVRRDRATVYRSIGAHGERIEKLRAEVDSLNTTVYGNHSSKGLEDKLRNAMQPMQTEIGILGERIEKLTIAIARANPTMRLDDLR